MAPPFSDFGLAAVNARVAIALVKRERRLCPKKDISPLVLIGMTTARLDGLHIGELRLALLSLSVAVQSGRHSEAWLKDVIYRDLMGYSLRRCFYADYKGNRR